MKLFWVAFVYMHLVLACLFEEIVILLWLIDHRYYGYSHTQYSGNQQKHRNPPENTRNPIEDAEIP